MSHRIDPLFASKSILACAVSRQERVKSTSAMFASLPATAERIPPFSKSRKRGLRELRTSSTGDRIPFSAGSPAPQPEPRLRVRPHWRRRWAHPCGEGQERVAQARQVGGCRFPRVLQRLGQKEYKQPRNNYDFTMSIGQGAFSSRASAL
jgi:hypothetical protein